MLPVPEARIAHHIPGRLRLKVPCVKQEPALGEALGRELQRCADVVDVCVRPGTGSVVVRYHSNGRDADAFLGSLASVVYVAGEKEPARVSERPPGPSAGGAAEWIYQGWSRLNGGLRGVTRGALDLGTVIPLFFVLLGVRQLLEQPGLAMVPWYVAFYYAFESFSHYHGRPAS